MKFVCLLMMFCLAAGCGTVRAYPGPVKTSNDVARIEGTTYFWGIAAQNMGLCEVDGKRLVNQSDSSETPQYAIEVLPGSHQITVCYSRSNASKTVRSPFDLEFTLPVEAGHVYKIDFKTKVAVTIWVTDETTGVRVWEGETLPPFPM